MRSQAKIRIKKEKDSVKTRKKRKAMPEELKGKLKMGKTARDSKFELLRIFSMLLIILHHLACHGRYRIDASVPEINAFLVRAFLVGGKLGVNVFVLISGYFLADKSFNIKRLLRLLAEAMFYSGTIYLIFVFTGRVDFNFRQLIREFLPSLTGRYWFMTAYVVAYALSPFMNKALSLTSKFQHAILLVFLMFLQCVMSIWNYGYLSNTGWFLTLYVLASYIKKYGLKLMKNAVFCFVVFVVALAAMVYFYAERGYEKIYLIKHPVCVIASVALFNGVRLIKKSFSSKIINAVAASTLGVYLIHDNNYVRRMFLWTELLKCPQAVYKENFPWFAVLSVFGIFIACAIIDTVRRLLLEKPLFILIDKGIDKIGDKISERRAKREQALLSETTQQ